MSCCVLSCENNENSTAPHIAFYKFPKEYHSKQLWIEAIGIPEWQLRSNSKICSAHFCELDFTISLTGERNLMEGAVPNLFLDTPSNLQTPAEFRTCRVCLAIDRKMYHIRDGNLHYMYEMIVGVMAEPTDRLPQMLCWECTSRLTSMKAFKEKAQKTHILLCDKLSASNILTIGDIKTIDRINNSLNSHLTHKYNEANTIDVHIEDDQLTVLQEVKIEYNKIKKEPSIVELDLDFKVENDDVKDKLSLRDSGSDSDDLYLTERMTKKPRKVLVKPERTSTRKRMKKKEVEQSEKVNNKYQRAVKRPTKPTELSNFITRRLTEEEQLAHLQARARSAAYLAAPHKCEVCYKGFRSADTLAQHAVRHSEKCGKYECFVCKRRFRIPSHLRLHVARNHSEQFSCKECKFVTQCRTAAVDHQKWHSGNTYTCPHCPTILGKFTSYMSHLRVKHSSRFPCELCGYTYVSERGVRVHKAMCHKLNDTQMKLEGPYCEECNLQFANDEAYQRHLTQSSVHSSDKNPKRIRNEKNYQVRKRRAAGDAKRPKERTGRPPGRPRLSQPDLHCEQCGEEQETYKAYGKHFRAAHPGLIRTKFPRATGNCMCDQCGKMFATKTLLLDHSATHSGEKRFKCDTCDKGFTSKKNLRAHMNMHGEQVTTFSCPYCERQFSHYQNCDRHVRTVHKGVKQFQCGICGKEFTSAAGQRAHVDHVHHKKPRPKRVRVRAPPVVFRDW